MSTSEVRKEMTDELTASPSTTSATPTAATGFPPAEFISPGFEPLSFKLGSSGVNMKSEKRTIQKGRPSSFADTLPSAAVSPPHAAVAGPSAAFSLPLESGPSQEPRGRPPGTCNSSKNVGNFGNPIAGWAGPGFKPDVMILKAGEDVTQRIMAYTMLAPRAVCILSASGAVSTVTLRRDASPGGIATYEGQYDILTLSGVFMLPQSDAPGSKRGMLSISLATRDGFMLCGVVAGAMIAKSTVQVVLGTFDSQG